MGRSTPRRTQGMTEYMVIVGLIAVLLISAVNTYGFRVDEAIQGTNLALMTRMAPPADGTPDGTVNNSFRGFLDNGSPVTARSSGGEWKLFVGSAPYDRGTHGAISSDPGN